MAAAVLGAVPAAGAVPATATPAAGAAASWSVMRSPNAQVRQNELAGVSCASARGCVAVGSLVGRAGTGGPLAKVWNGRVWRAVPVPVPRAAVSARLGAVSCPSAGMCMAVGAYTKAPPSGEGFPLAERWDGRRWALLAVPGPGGLTAVSCTSPAACTAVGRNNAGELAERWDGRAWAVQPIPGLFRGGFNGVSCTSATACTAVGSYLTDDDVHSPLAEVWDGTTWVFQPTPGVPDLSVLRAVSCTSASACIAVGEQTPNNDDLARHSPLAERWDGSAWTLLTVPDPAGQGSLAGVSCAAATVCTAVGQGEAGALAERWDGTAWAAQPTPRAAAAGLAGVSCPAASTCTAAGGFVRRVRGALVTLAERWEGTTWAIQPTPGNPAGMPGNSLTGVSCPRAARCAAVGSAGFGALAERWNGRKWAIQRIDNPATAMETQLAAVSCPAANRCTAVGSYQNQPGRVNFRKFLTLAERWNGRRWAIQRTPRPAGVTRMMLSGVSCTSASACTAVGSADSAALAERWNGHTWAIQPTPVPGGLAAVSCTAARWCMAVGSGGSNGSLAERWNGHTWATLPIPGPGGFASVSCTSARACTAVGSSTILRWNGSRWARQRTPPSASDLAAVSCASARACTAAGGGFGNRGEQTVALHWNGSTWAVQRTPSSQQGGGRSFDAVSCTPAQVCTAAGSQFGPPASRTLAERHS